MSSFGYSYTGYRLTEAADQAEMLRAVYPDSGWTTKNEFRKLWSGMVC